MSKSRLFNLILLLLFFTSAALAQQISTISGSVTTSDGKPAPFISVGLKGKSIGSITAEDGTFTLTRIKPGNYIKRYYKGWTTIEPQMPRNLVANITYKF